MFFPFFLHFILSEFKVGIYGWRCVDERANMIFTVDFFYMNNTVEGFLMFHNFFKQNEKLCNLKYVRLNNVHNCSKF